MIRTSRLAAIAALSLLLAACSSGGGTTAASAPGSPGPSGSAEVLCERAPDPNSPFAKLAALKAQLESRDSDKG